MVNLAKIVYKPVGLVGSLAAAGHRRRAVQADLED